MNVLIDVLLLTVIVISAIKHYRSGLMHSIFGVGKFLISIFVSAMFGKPIGAMLADGIIGEKLTDSVYLRISRYVDGQALSDFFDNLPKGFLNLLDLLGADVNKLEAQYGTADGGEIAIREMSAVVARPIADTVSSIIACVLVFLVTYIILTVVIFSLKHIKIPIITSIDKYLGLALGAVLGFFAAALISTAVYSVSEFIAAMNSDSQIMDVYNNSLIFKFIYDLRIFEFIRKLI